MEKSSPWRFLPTVNAWFRPVRIQRSWSGISLVSARWINDAPGSFAPDDGPETFGSKQWHGRETVPQRGWDLRSQAVARSGDSATRGTVPQRGGSSGY